MTMKPSQIVLDDRCSSKNVHPLDFRLPIPPPNDAIALVRSIAMDPSLLYCTRWPLFRQEGSSLLAVDFRLGSPQSNDALSLARSVAMEPSLL